jgi:hypothetical protein
LRREHRIEAFAATLKAYLPRMSDDTAAAWGAVLEARRFDAVSVIEVDEETGEEIEVPLTELTLVELREACGAYAVEMRSTDWPGLAEIIGHCRAVRRVRVIAEQAARASEAVAALPARASLSEEESRRNASEARKALDYLRTKLGLRGDVLATARPTTSETSVAYTPGDFEAAERRRAELRAQGLRLVAMGEGE